MATLRNKDAARFMDPETGEVRSAHLDEHGFPRYSSKPDVDALEFDPKPSMFDLVRAQVARELALRQEEVPTLRSLLEDAEFLAEDVDDDTPMTDYEVDRLGAAIARSRERERILAAAVAPPSPRKSSSLDRGTPPEGVGSRDTSDQDTPRDPPPQRGGGSLPPEDQ